MDTLSYACVEFDRRARRSDSDFSRRRRIILPDTPGIVSSNFLGIPRKAIYVTFDKETNPPGPPLSLVKL